VTLSPHPAKGSGTFVHRIPKNNTPKKIKFNTLLRIEFFMIQDKKIFTNYVVAYRFAHARTLLTDRKNPE